MGNKTQKPEKTQHDAKLLLGEVAFSSSQTTYKVMVEANGLNMRWYATVVKNEQINFISEIWCSDNYTEEYMKLKKSVKKKIRKMVEGAVSNLA